MPRVATGGAPVPFTLVSPAEPAYLLVTFLNFYYLLDNLPYTNLVDEGLCLFYSSIKLISTVSNIKDEF